MFLKLRTDKIHGPMIYPLLVNKNGLRQFLISNNIFVAQYWDNVSSFCIEDSFEYELAENLIAIPIDQRYTISDMKYLIELLNKGLNE